MVQTLDSCLDQTIWFTDVESCVLGPQAVRNPMIGLSFAKRLASFQIALAKVLFPTRPAPPEATEIVRYLAPFPVSKSTAATGNDKLPVWTSWENATVQERYDETALFS